MGVVGAVACMLTSTTIMSIFLVLALSRAKVPIRATTPPASGFPVVLNSKEGHART